MKSTSSRFLAGVAGLLAAVLLVAPAAAAAPAPPAEATASCGFYRGLTGAYYKHCTSEPYSVKITIRYLVAGWPDREMCVAPNADEWIGWNDEVFTAFYNGNLC